MYIINFVNRSYCKVKCIYVHYRKQNKALTKIKLNSSIKPLQDNHYIFTNVLKHIGLHIHKNIHDLTKKKELYGLPFSLKRKSELPFYFNTSTPEPLL